MNKRTLLSLALSAVVLLGTSAFAQNATATAPTRGGYGHGGRRGGEFAGLSLTTDQKAQIKTIHEEQRTKMDTLNKESHTKAEFRTQSMSIRKEAHDKIVNNVLTGEQRAQLAQRQQQHQQRWGGKPPVSNQ
jgi:Spy/CpxP family protein refolding chaperone